MKLVYDSKQELILAVGQSESNSENLRTQQTETVAPAGDSAGPKQVEPPNFLSSMLPFIVIFVAFYFLLLRPGQKKEKQRKEKIGSVKKDDRVVTIGGMVGKVVSVEADEVVLVVEDKTRLRFKKSAIADVNGAVEVPAKS